MHKYILLITVLIAACSTAPEIDTFNPHANILKKDEMRRILIKRYFSCLHCRNADVKLLEIKEIKIVNNIRHIPVVAFAELYEISGVGGGERRVNEKALYHFYKNEDNQWKVKRVKKM